MRAALERRSRFASAIRFVALTGGSVAFALAVSELALRILGLYAPVDCHRLPPHSRIRDVQSGWDITYRTNSLGFRDREQPLQRPSGVDNRIVVVGDSFPFGQGVEEASAFPARLATVLDSGGATSEVINVSNIGIATESYFILLRDAGLAFSPDVVVLNLFGNDASYDSGKSWLRVWSVAASERSHLAALFRITWSRFRTRATGEYVNDPPSFWTHLESVCAARLPKPECATMTRGFRARFGPNVNNLAAACLADPEEVRREIETDTRVEGWRDLARYVEKVRDACRASRTRLVLAVVPDGAQVDPDQLMVRKSLGVSYDTEVLTEMGGFQSKVHDLAMRLGLEVYDPLAAFRARRDGLYYPGDFHWTPEGHRLYAEGLASFLREHGYLRPRAVP